MGGSGGGWGRRKRKITFIRIRARYDTKGYVLHKIPLAPSLLDLLTNISGDILILSGELANSFIQTFISLGICYSQVAVSQIVLLSFSTTIPLPHLPVLPFIFFFFTPRVYFLSFLLEASFLFDIVSFFFFFFIFHSLASSLLVRS